MKLGLISCATLVAIGLMGACAKDEGDARVGFETDASSATPTFDDDNARRDAGDDATCAGTIVPLSREPVYMLIIMDGSGSMLDPLVPNGPTGLKWQAARDAFVSFVDDVAKANDVAFGLGLFLFDGTKGVPDFLLYDVPIAYVDAKHAGVLKQRVLGADPQGGTPIKRALEGQIPLLEDFVPLKPLKPNGKRVLVVMTDGVPDGPSDVQPQVQQQCVDLVDNARLGKGQITTFAVGVGDPQSVDTTYNEVFVGRLAIAGGAAPAGCTQGWSESSPSSAKPCHFQVTPGQKTAAQIKDELVSAIDDIRGAVASCEFPLEQADGSLGVPDPNKVNVVFTDASGKTTIVPKDEANGWSYDDPNGPTKVIFHGDACKRVKSEADGKVSIELGCATRVN